MDGWSTRASSEDLSVDFVRPAGDEGSREARYVRRRPEHAAVHFSSRSGCRQACRTCHLTATGQTTERGATLEDCLAPADVVLEHRDRMEGVHGRPGLVNVDPMACGEPPATPHVLSGWRALSDALRERMVRRGMGMQLNVSTIMPYAMDPGFRRRWLPHAAASEAAPGALAEGLAGLSSRQGPRVGFDMRASCGMFAEAPATRRRAA